jgi:excisionase family DNA binding protein
MAAVSTLAPEYLTPQQVAQLLAVSLCWVYKASAEKRGKNRLPAIRIGHSLRYRRADLDAWLEKRKAA